MSQGDCWSNAHARQSGCLVSQGMGGRVEEGTEGKGLKLPFPLTSSSSDPSHLTIHSSETSMAGLSVYVIHNVLSHSANARFHES